MRTFGFFNAHKTIPNLFRYLKAIQVYVRIMAWLMKHDNELGVGDALADTGNSGKVKQVLEFVSPSQSVIWQALQDACALLDPTQGRN